MLQWSRSTVNSFSAKEQTEFETSEGSFEHLVCSIFDQPWSPCVWRGGRRSQANFLSADVIALDFDGGARIRDVSRSAFSMGMIYAIATTKSHRKEKFTDEGVVRANAVDRFRLVIPAFRRINTVEEYRWALGHAMSKFPGCDTACRDAARFFFQCKMLSVYCGDGVPFSWVEMSVEPPVEKSEIPSIPTGKISSKVIDRLLYGTEDGTRHKFLVKDCFHLGAQGISEPEARDMVANSGYTLPVEEKIRIFNSQWRKGWNLFCATNEI